MERRSYEESEIQAAQIDWWISGCRIHHLEGSAVGLEGIPRNPKEILSDSCYVQGGVCMVTSFPTVEHRPWGCTRGPRDPEVRKGTMGILRHP